MNCLTHNKEVTILSVGSDQPEFLLCVDCVEAMSEDRKSKSDLKTLAELVPDEAARKEMVAELTSEVDTHRNEIKNQKETVKDCHDTFCEEMMKQCHQNLLDNNIHNILETYNERFQQARSDWEDDKSLKNLRKLSESYALLLKIEDLQKKRDSKENSDKLVLDGIKQEMERLQKVCGEQIKGLHDKHLEDIKEHVNNGFEEYVKKPIEES